MNNVEIKDRLRMVRTANCLTQTNLSSMSQIPQISLSALERGKYKPNPQIIAKLSSCFNVNSRWLEAGIGSPFEDSKGILELNPCKEHAGESSALSLLSATGLPFVFYEKDKCLLSKISPDCHLIIHLREPVDKNIFMNIGRCHYLGEINYEIDLRSPYILERLFTKGDNAQGIASYQDTPMKETAAPTETHQTVSAKGETSPNQHSGETASLKTLSTKEDINKPVPLYKTVKGQEPGVSAKKDLSRIKVNIVREEEPMNNDILLAKVELFLHNDPEFSHILKEFLESYKASRK